MYQVRPILYAMLGILLVWVVAWAGFAVSARSRITAQDVSGYMQEVDLTKLNGESRKQALDELSRKLVGLSPDERRRIRFDAAWNRWLQEMNEDEKRSFIQATLPGNFQQMINSFEQLPENKRKYALRKAIERVQNARTEALDGKGADKIIPVELSPELQQRVIGTGLKKVFTESSAQTKAELAPFLEELQRLMESGRLFKK